MKRAIGALILLGMGSIGGAHASSRVVMASPASAERVVAQPGIDTPSPATALSFFFSALLVMRGRRPRGPR